MSDFYELTTACSRIIQNAVGLFETRGASPLMRERRKLNPTSQMQVRAIGLDGNFGLLIANFGLLIAELTGALVFGL
jgi:hypothetical protein